MAEAYIIDAVRTPVGRRGGGLAALYVEHAHEVERAGMAGPLAQPFLREVPQISALDRPRT